MEASKDSCQDRRERVNALGTEVVPDVRPTRNEVSGGPSASPVPARELHAPDAFPTRRCGR